MYIFLQGKQYFKVKLVHSLIFFKSFAAEQFKHTISVDLHDVEFFLLKKLSVFKRWMCLGKKNYTDIFSALVDVGDTDLFGGSCK